MKKGFNIGGFIILLILIFAIGRVDTAWNIIVKFATNMWKFLLRLPQLIKPFIPFLGIKNIAVSLFILGIVLMIASGLGIYISHKCKSKLWTVISGVVEIISTIITIGFAAKI